MARENFANFASTSLVSPNPLTSGGTSFTVTTGEGARFPTSNFAVTIETEILLITSRSGDTFTVGTRGFDGTTAASHAAAVTIQLSAIAYNFTHLWQNVSDTINPLVPTTHLGGSASSYDNEFESLGGWTLFPSSPASGSVWDAGSTLRSHLTLDRATNDSTVYTAYISFPNISGAFMVTAKVSMAANVNHGTGTTDQAQFSLFVSDQTNPTGGPNTGNRVKATVEQTIQIDTGTASAAGWLKGSAYQVRLTKVVSGSESSYSSAVALNAGSTCYLRIYRSGSNIYRALVGDGITFWELGAPTMTFSTQSIGISAHLTGSFEEQTFAVDFVRVNLSPGNFRFGAF